MSEMSHGPSCIQINSLAPADARSHMWASFDGKDRTELGLLPLSLLYSALLFHVTLLCDPFV